MPVQTSTPSTSIVEVASSRVQKHLLVSNLAIELAKEHTIHLYSRGYKFQVQKHLPTLDLAVEFSEIHRVEEFKVCFSLVAKVSKGTDVNALPFSFGDFGCL